jgi:gamma-glutamyltranspeptidase
LRALVPTVRATPETECARSCAAERKTFFTRAGESDFCSRVARRIPQQGGTAAPAVIALMCRFSFADHVKLA